MAKSNTCSNQAWCVERVGFFCGSAHRRKESPGFPMPLSRAGERGNTGAYSHTLKKAFKHTLPYVQSAKNHTWCKHQVEPETLSSPVSECLCVLTWGWFLHLLPFNWNQSLQTDLYFPVKCSSSHHIPLISPLFRWMQINFCFPVLTGGISDT